MPLFANTTEKTQRLVMRSCVSTPHERFLRHKRRGPSWKVALTSVVGINELVVLNSVVMAHVYPYLERGTRTEPACHCSPAPRQNWTRLTCSCCMCEPTRLNRWLGFCRPGGCCDVLFCAIPAIYDPVTYMWDGNSRQ